MKKIVAIILSICVLFVVLSGCAQSMTRSFGGSMTIELESDQKLEMITWKDDSLWYLTRPMRDDEEPEIHIFQESSSIGVLEGTVTVIESKSE